MVVTGVGIASGRRSRSRGHRRRPPSGSAPRPGDGRSSSPAPAPRSTRRRSGRRGGGGRDGPSARSAGTRAPPPVSAMNPVCTRIGIGHAGCRHRPQHPGWGAGAGSGLCVEEVGDRGTGSAPGVGLQGRQGHELRRISARCRSRQPDLVHAAQRAGGAVREGGGHRPGSTGRASTRTGGNESSPSSMAASSAAQLTPAPRPWRRFRRPVRRPGARRRAGARRARGRWRPWRRPSSRWRRGARRG